MSFRGADAVSPNAVELHCHIHGDAFVTYPSVYHLKGSRGYPVCVGLIRARVQLEFRRWRQPVAITDRDRLFEGLCR